MVSSGRSLFGVDNVKVQPTLLFFCIPCKYGAARAHYEDDGTLSPTDRYGRRDKVHVTTRKNSMKDAYAFSDHVFFSKRVHRFLLAVVAFDDGWDFLAVDRIHYRVEAGIVQ